MVTGCEMTTAAEQSEREDGRQRRATISKALVVGALLDLLRAGEIDPSIRDIATRAGVSERTVFRHYEDTEQLFAAAVIEQLRRIAPLMDMPRTGGPRRGRIGDLVRQRVRLYEEISPVMRAAMREAPLHPVIREGDDRFQAALRGQVTAIFADEISCVPKKDQRLIVASLEAMTSWAVWESLRTTQRLGIDVAASVMKRSVEAILRDVAGDEGPE
jgi:AcrR family transcriptional regulator